MTAIQAWHDAPIADLDGPAPEIDARAEIEALDLADMHLWHVARLRRELAVQDELYRRAIARIEDRHLYRRGVIERQIEWRLTPLRQLHDALHEIDPKRLTIELPHGDLKMRVPKKPQVFIDDDAAIVEWAKTAAPELLPPPEKVKVTELRKIANVVTHADGTYAVLTVHGSFVPGVHAEIPQPTWNADTEVDL